MNFWWGTDLGDVLFRGLSVDSVPGLVCVCAVSMALCISYEGLKVIEMKMNRRRCTNVSGEPCSDDYNNLLDNSYKNKALSATMSFTNNSMHYILMLIVMMYNGYVFVSVILGLSIGYFVFGFLGTITNINLVKNRWRTEARREDVRENGDESFDPPLMTDTSNFSQITCEVQINRDDSTRSVSLEETEAAVETAPASEGAKKTTDPSKIKSSNQTVADSNPRISTTDDSETDKID